MILLGAKLAASLLSVLALAWFARWLGLGAEQRVRDDEHALQIARETLNGFQGVAAAVDRAGYAALVKDAQNRHVLIRSMGAHFITRMVTPPVEGRLDRTMLTIDVREADVAPVTLNLGDQAQYWASGLRHIPADARHA